jgi:hypothetical protein
MRGRMDDRATVSAFGQRYSDLRMCQFVHGAGAIMCDARGDDIQGRAAAG